MKHFFRTGFLLPVALLGLAPAATAQVPEPFLVTSACPGSAANPSVLRRIEPSNALTTIGTINNGVDNLILNGIGADDNDPVNIYGMTVEPGGGIAALTPQFYRVNLTTAAATLVGTVTAPPTPAVPPGSPFGSFGAAFSINLAADGAPGSRYFLTGASAVLRTVFVPSFGFRINPGTLRLHLGEINLTANNANPTWRLVDTSDPTTSAIITDLESQFNTYLAGGAFPSGGFQDIAYVPSTGNIISYLGPDQKIVTVTNISTSPVAVTTTPSTLIPVTTEVGSMFKSATGDLYAMVSATGRAYRISPTTGAWDGTSFLTGVGCSLGDATTAPGLPPLPVTLTAFTAESAVGGVRIAWQTASEEGVARFVVERSLDARKWADGPSAVPTNHPAGARYTLLDESPAALVGAQYYRLRTEDQSGAKAWSDARLVTFGTAPAALLPAWPNPASATMRVVLTRAVAGEAQLVNRLGQVAWRGALVGGQVVVDVSKLPVGIYELRAVLADGHTTQQRIVVAR